MSPLFTYKNNFPVSAQELYHWHARPGALERLIPPWERTWVLRRQGEGLAPGTRAWLRIHAGPLPLTWQAHHLRAEPGEAFVDEQERGPFSLWQHEHLFANAPGGGASLEDRIHFKLPLAPLSSPFNGAVQRLLARIFASRHATLAADLDCHRRYSSRPLRFLISGASGVLGQALLPFLSTGGHEVWTLVRRPVWPGAKELFWQPEADSLDISTLPPIDVVVHLAGENISQGRWSAAKKKRIIDSRVRSTQLLAHTFAQLNNPPRAFLSASAIGYYGDGGGQWLSEQAPQGHGFIARVCQQWEEAALPAQQAGMRTVLMRIGVVLTPRGGALPQLVMASRLGLKALGTGLQYVSWISLDDLLASILHLAVTEELAGPVNLVAPQPARNEEILSRLSQLAWAKAPAWLLRASLGELADEAILASCRAQPDCLMNTGFSFRHPQLGQALSHQLGRRVN